MEKDLGRGLRTEKLKKFKQSNWYQFFKNHTNELFLGIRNNYINIYYKGMSICKSQGLFNKAQIAKKYLGINESGDKSITFDEFEKNYEKIKKRVDDHVKGSGREKTEKRVQQALMMQNNKNEKSNWYCIDMEYDKQRKSINDGEKSGRFDIIAVSKKKNSKNKYRVALIELKVEKNAISGSSGLLKHTDDWNKFIIEARKNKEYLLRKELVNIINNKYELEKDFPIKECTIDELEFEPEFYFIICSGNVKNIKNETGKYLWNEKNARKYGVKGNISTKNIENSKKVGYDITKKGAGPLYAQFLFIDGEGKNITDIIDDSQYDKNVKDIR